MADATRALVLRSAGTNCDAETVRALTLGGASTDLLHLNRIAEEPQRLGDYRILVIPGGFSYGDYVAAGRIFGFELRHRLGEEIHGFVASGGLVLGICNGFQILVELGLLSTHGASGMGKGELARDVALTDNASNRFECRWVTLRSEECACPWIVPGETVPVPVAHAEGRFVVRDDATLQTLRAQGQIALTYTSSGSAGDGSNGQVPYPDCPNGSLAAIAGVCDPTGRVLGLMPHPERNVTPWNRPDWTRISAREEGEGLPFFRRMVQVAGEGAISAPVP